MTHWEKIASLKPAETTVHPFERAGLGKAPFRFVGHYESKFQAIPGDPSCPILPGSSCDYCGQGIMQVCVIRDAAGKEFKVGCDCVKRTDAPLRKLVDKAMAAKRRASTEKRVAEVAEKLTEYLARDDVRATLSSRPHPMADRGPFFATKTALDWATWMAERAGASGRDRVLKAIQKAIAS